MKVELFQFQKKAVQELRDCVAEALGSYQRRHAPQVVSFTAPTGSGKTIIMASLIEDIFFGTDAYVEQPDAIIVWLSDSPQLNEQSKLKIDLKADKIRLDQCITITDDSFDKEMLDEGHIYFLNTQKLGKSSNLTKHSDTRQYTIWETLANTVNEKCDKLYFIIDEAHRGMQGREAGKATSIMQKFLKGSTVDKIPPMPVVIGMSATIDRFNKLVEGTTSTTHKVVVNPADVRASGLLKERIVITYPEDKTTHNDMAVLQAAADEWKDKCLHWYQYSTEQHRMHVNPVFVVQVENGHDDVISATDLSDCIRKIEERTGYHFENNQVVHTFGMTGTITIGGLDVPHVDPSAIADDKRIRLVFFKDNLSTGWDCPRAETMMSFRRAHDATFIAQLLGRMVRTPLQRRIDVDETLNDVHLFLPYFDEDTVRDVIKELQDAEGGDIPTIIDGESIETPKYTTWSTRTKKQIPGQISFDDIGVTTEQLFGLRAEDSVAEQATTHTAVSVQLKSEDNTDVVPHVEATNINVNIPVAESTPKATGNDSTAQATTNTHQPTFEESKPAVQLAMIPTLDRDEVVKFINDFGLLTYEVKYVQRTKYLPSLINLAHLLTQSAISPFAIRDIKSDMVKMIRDHVEYLKSIDKYDYFYNQVLQFKLSTKIFDIFGDSVDNYTTHDLFTTTDTDLERQLRIADNKLGSIGISNDYGRLYMDMDDPYAYMVDVVLFVADDECLAKLGKYAENKFHNLNDENRKYFINASERHRKLYHDIIADGDIVSKHSFRLPETLRVKCDKDGKEYNNHLFVDDTGIAIIKLNGWEQGVLEEEARRPDFVCWLRNPPRENWSLCIPYEIDGETKATYPDFLVIRTDHKQEGGYAIDILEPHNPDFKDNLGKAKGFAKYAEENIGIGRIQLIREGTDPAGRKRFKRLDLALGVTRNKVLKAINNDELDHIFDTDGFFD